MATKPTTAIAVPLDETDLPGALRDCIARHGIRNRADDERRHLGARTPG